MSGRSRQALQKDFPNKDSIFREGTELLLNELRESLDPIGRESSPAGIKNAERTLFRLFTFMSRRKDIFNMICGDLDHQALLHQVAEIAFEQLNLKIPPSYTEKIIWSATITGAMVAIISRWGIDTCCDIAKISHYRNLMLNTIAALTRASWSAQ